MFGFIKDYLRRKEQKRRDTTFNAWKENFLQRALQAREIDVPGSSYFQHFLIALTVTSYDHQHIEEMVSRVGEQATVIWLANAFNVDESVISHL
jgi:hypothetical protein